MPHIPRNVHVHDVEVLLYLLLFSWQYRYCAVLRFLRFHIIEPLETSASIIWNRCLRPALQLYETCLETSASIIWNLKICSRGTTRISHAHAPYSCILIFYYVFFTTPVFPTNTSTLFPCQRHRGAIKELEALRSVTSHPISSGLNACALDFIHDAATCLFEHVCCLFLYYATAACVLTWINASIFLFALQIAEQLTEPLF